MEYCKEGVAVQAYSPLIKDISSDIQSLLEGVKKRGKTAAQVVLRWVLQQGDILVPKSGNQARIRENTANHNFQLDDEDLPKIAALDQGQAGKIDI